MHKRTGPKAISTSCSPTCFSVPAPAGWDRAASRRRGAACSASASVSVAPHHRDHGEPGLSPPSQLHRCSCSVFPLSSFFSPLLCAMFALDLSICIFFPPLLCPAASIKQFPILHLKKPLQPNLKESERILSSPQCSPPSCTLRVLLSPSVMHPGTQAWVLGTLLLGQRVPQHPSSMPSRSCLSNSPGSPAEHGCG